MKSPWWLFLLVMSPLWASPSMVVLDAGEGQALLVQQGNRGILIDTGHPGKTRHILDRLSTLGTTHLDYLILTHLHPDHAGGYFRLREAWPETPVLYNGQPLADDIRPDMTRWINDAISHDPLRRVITAGDRLQWQGITLEVLWPDEFRNPNLNAHSLVLLLTYGAVRVLIMGDATQQAEQALLRQGLLPDDIDVLIVGHHGAADASSKAFIEKIHPKWALISVNKNNIRGYPSPLVLQRLERAGVQVRRTDRDGEIILNLETGLLYQQKFSVQHQPIESESSGASNN